MKMTHAHFEMLARDIVPLDTTERRQRYRAGDFPRSADVQDLDKRYRWDLVYASGASGGLTWLGDYFDSHIYTALRNIVASLDTPDGPDSPRHRLHQVTVGNDGTNRCECGDTWPNAIGQTALDRALGEGR